MIGSSHREIGNQDLGLAQWVTLGGYWWRGEIGGLRGDVGGLSGLGFIDVIGKGDEMRCLWYVIE